MKTFKSKTILSTIAILMVLSFTVSMISLPGFVNAANTTYPFVDAIPNPVGVGQKVLVNFGLLNYLQLDGDGWNVTLSITDPNGHTTTVDRMTWSTGTVGYAFNPEIVGNYTLKCIFKGETYRNVEYAPSETPEYTLVVQENSVPTYPAQSMPTEYWTRPIDSQLREWWSVSGSWAYKPENLIAEANDAPTTAHILWTTPLGDTMGGLVGGSEYWGDTGYQNGDAYEGKFAGSVIISGVLYYNKYYTPSGGASPQQAIVAIDLHTGEKLWEKSYTTTPALPGTAAQGRITQGQILYWESLNNRGTWSYIYVTTSVTTGSGSTAVTNTTMHALDALTGDLKFNITNVPSGTIYVGPIGELLKYSIVNYGNATNPDYRLLQWNASILPSFADTNYQRESWGLMIARAQSMDGTKGYDMNVSITEYNTAANSAYPRTGSGFTTTIQKAYPGDKVILANVNYSSVQLWAFNLNASRGAVGSLLFNKNNPAPDEWLEGNITISSIGQAGWCAWSQPEDVAVFFSKENRVHYGYSLSTGEFLWETEPQIYADAWSDTVLAGFGPDRVIAYGKLYSATVGGIVYAYDLQTGDLVWEYAVKDMYGESYLTNNWWVIPLFVSGDKIYFGTLEHSALEPKPRGGPFLCLNATDGSVIFEADGLFRQTRWGGRAIMGDSIIATQDTYDQQIYAIGKGPSTMTLTTPDTAVTANTPVIIKGTVMDNSPGTKAADAQLRFPNGVPAVSDASQSEWMLYVYKQFSQPMDTVGVPVSIDAVDPNGNYIHLGDTTSDASGQFYFTYTPTVEGQYTVYATFGGSAAYYGSFAQNAMTVMEAAAQPTETAQVNNTPYEMYTIGMGVAIIAVVAIVGLLILRKK
ncbi:MAG: PQQ-binding-like beta-propeller repeat protein [Candidatus Bathyarchaeia archaeon]